MCHAVFRVSKGSGVTVLPAKHSASKKTIFPNNASRAEQICILCVCASVGAIDVGRGWPWLLFVVGLGISAGSVLECAAPPCTAGTKGWLPDLFGGRTP